MVDFGRRAAALIHAPRHEDGGADEISLASLSGELADDQPAKAHDLAGASHNADTLADLNAKVSDATLDDSGDARTPSAHKTSHQDGGTDEISVASLSGLLADEQNAGKVKGVIINDAAKADQKTLAYDSGSDRIIYITPAAGGAALNSIQQGTISITSGNLTNTATINAVDTDKAFLLHLGNTAPSSTGPKAIHTRLTLTDATTVTATRGVTDSEAAVRFVVIEFSSGIASIQRGTISLDASGDGTAAINAVNTDKAFVIHSGQSTNTGNSYQGDVRITLNTSTQVQAWGSASGANRTVAFEVVEFE